MFWEPLLGGKEGMPRFRVRCCTIFDMVVLLLHEEQETERIITHSIAADKRTQSVHVGLSALERAVMAGDNNELVSSLISGEVIWDPKGILAEMRKQLTQFEGPLKERVLFMEFARFYICILSPSVILKQGVPWMPIIAY
ncbi:nucleotidyltransferase-like protein [Paenibacillus rhizoplanae]